MVDLYHFAGGFISSLQLPKISILGRPNTLVVLQCSQCHYQQRIYQHIEKLRMQYHRYDTLISMAVCSKIGDWIILVQEISMRFVLQVKAGVNILVRVTLITLAVRKKVASIILSTSIPLQHQLISSFFNFLSQLRPFSIVYSYITVPDFAGANR